MADLPNDLDFLVSHRIRLHQHSSRAWSAPAWGAPTRSSPTGYAAFYSDWPSVSNSTSGARRLGETTPARGADFRTDPTRRSGSPLCSAFLLGSPQSRCPLSDEFFDLGLPLYDSANGSAGYVPDLVTKLGDANWATVPCNFRCTSLAFTALKTRCRLTSTPSQS